MKVESNSWSSYASRRGVHEERQTEGCVEATADRRMRVREAYMKKDRRKDVQRKNDQHSVTENERNTKESNRIIFY